MYLMLGLFLYLLIVISLVWARFFFFKMNNGTPRILALSYDLSVAIQMIVTVYSFNNVTDVTKIPGVIAPLLYLLSLVIFWSSIVTARSLDFAFSNRVGNIVTTGPFGFFRHPFYVSYLLAWWGSTILFNSILLWLTALYLTGFYVVSAKKEEKTILESKQSEQYRVYKQNTGMFFPRIKKWKL
jgi:protein-S-isoprenylcysteine O-methyltransferase Ste14